MCEIPVYSYGQRTINLWFNNGIQEGDGAILLVVLYCKPYSRVNTVYVLKEALFVGLLVDDKGVNPHTCARTWGWSGEQCLELFVLSTPCIDWPQWGWLGNPWQHPRPVHRTGLGKKGRCFWDKSSIGG